MPNVEQGSPLTMGWCLDCHRQPERHLRPQSEITNLSWAAADPGLGRELAKQYDVHTRTSCTTCHR
jgi:hypothetical protein